MSSAVLSLVPSSDVSMETSDLPTEHLEAEICSLAGSIAAATCRLLLLLAEFDRREAWGSWGASSCAHWLSWKCGFSLGAARERVRVARCLPSLPLVVSLFSRGELSFAKVRALTRIATPENEATLVEMAKAATTPQLERIVRAYRNCEDVNERHDRRSFSWYWDEDGSFVFSGRLSPEDGALLLNALKSVATETSVEAQADALVMLAKGFSGETPAQTTLVTVDAATLSGDADNECSITDGPALHPETARRICCDGSAIGMKISSDGAPLDIGRKTRIVPPSIRRFLQRRDNGTCQFPSCANTRFIDAHHVIHWSQGGSTSAENLILLCGKHHRAVHEGGFGLVRRADQFIFSKPDGVTIPAVATTSSGNQRLPEIPPDALESSEGGEPFSLADTVEALLWLQPQSDGE